MRKPLKITDCKIDCQCNRCVRVPKIKGVRQCWNCDDVKCPNFKGRPCKMYTDLDIWRMRELSDTYEKHEIKKNPCDYFKREAVKKEAELKASQQKLFKEV